MVIPMGTHPKDITCFLYQKQYLLKPKGKVILIPLMERPKKQGFLIKSSNPYHTLISG